MTIREEIEKIKEKWEIDQKNCRNSIRSLEERIEVIHTILCDLSDILVKMPDDE